MSDGGPRPTWRTKHSTSFRNGAITTQEIVRAIIAAADSDLESIVQNLTAPHEEEYLDNAKARRLLGWKPQYELSAGLRKTLGWYRQGGGSIGVQRGRG